MQPAYAKIAKDPRFADLVSKRNRFAVALSLIVLAVFSAFVFVAVALPGVFSARIDAGSAWTWGLIAGWLIQIFAFLITGVYTLRANGEFDPAIRSIIAEATK
ncbi:DUF485 domain-containing protein [Allorhizobium borbori]|uniref:Uncharacterized membrane protein (DUF485 family) n=1 Tax=Allorhizobium borbori TaxID=485907 RepID=A0A7W6K3U6_9HYPH|nr:DUF485 domain-containing protein [Allorhizobium borbori]MBB4104683.1 uncharacterized membrane protein (DUF485 family) [Allorhizobium borbori]PZU23490.1 MAG: DUF485 domain-containing protein [Shinella sp.]